MLKNSVIDPSEQLALNDPTIKDAGKAAARAGTTGDGKDAPTQSQSKPQTPAAAPAPTPGKPGENIR